MKNLSVALLLVCAGAWADPDNVKLGNSSDGLIAHCEKAGDVGTWGYVPRDLQVTEGARVLNLNVKLDFVTCEDDVSGYIWLPRNPYQSYTRIINGVMETINLTDMRGVLADVETHGRWEVKMNTASTQVFSYATDASEIEGALARLKNGETYTKELYVFVDYVWSKASDSVPHFGAGGSFVITLKWTRHAGVLKGSASIN